MELSLVKGVQRDARNSSSYFKVADPGATYAQKAAVARNFQEVNRLLPHDETLAYFEYNYGDGGEGTVTLFKF